MRVTVNATGLKAGNYRATLLVSTTDPGESELRVPIHITIKAVPPSSLYLSVGSATTVGGLSVADEDIFGVNPESQVTPYFDGSDVGLTGLTVDAFARLADGSLALSFTQPATVPGISGTVDDSDLVRFIPTSVGQDTAGRFELWFDGSDVGLSTDDEDIDAVEVLADGRIAFSTTGDLKVTGADAADEDLTAFTSSSLGAATTGTFAVLFDGSDVGLSASEEDLDAAAIRSDGVIGLSTVGALSVPGLTATNDDVVAFTPTLLGQDTRGTFSSTPVLRGASLGLGPHDVTGVDFP
jgi:hypothetical protein